MSGIFGGAPQTTTTTPDYAAQAQANQYAQLTPNGNQVYGTYDNGQFTPNANQQAIQVQQTPFQNTLVSGGQGLSLGLLNSLQQNGTANLTPAETPQQIQASLPQLSQNFSGDASNVANATYNQSANLLQPQMQLQQRQLAQSLANQGLPPGSEAYNSAMNQLNTTQGAQLNNLSLGAVNAGYAQNNTMEAQQAANQNQLYNQGQGYASLGNQQQAAAFGQLGSLLGFASPFTQFSTPQSGAIGMTSTTTGGTGNALAAGLIGGQALQGAGGISGLSSLFGSGAAAGGAEAGIEDLAPMAFV